MIYIHGLEWTIVKTVKPHTAWFMCAFEVASVFWGTTTLDVHIVALHYNEEWRD